MGAPAVVDLQPLPVPPGSVPSPRPGLVGQVRRLVEGGRRGTVIAALCALLSVPAAVGAWALSAPAGAVGHDVSYPQCGTSLPTGGTFGVVGVNGGRVSTPNPCLASQYSWASARQHGAALYVNTGNPGSISTFYWPASGSRDPALCTDRTSAADAGCAYDYGWHGAASSLQIATNALGAGVTDRSWWLDVELANSWNGTTTANAAALQGAVDRLHESGIDTVGIYSTSYQWGQITGGYRSTNAASYRAAWAGAFTPRHPMETAPLWIAGLGTADAASANCSASFTGAAPMIAQYSDDATDGDLMCGKAPAPPSTTPTTTPTATPTATETATPTTSSASPTSSAPATTTQPTSTAVPSTTSAPSTTTSAPSTTTSAPSTTTSAPSTTTTSPATSSTTPTTSLTSTTSPTATPPTTPTTVPPVSRYPGAPLGVVARTATNRGIVMSWVAPTITAGSPITRYVVLRGTAPGREAVLGVLPCATPTCAWQDTSVTGGRTAYYQVVAVNAANVAGYRSLEVAARGR